MEGGAPRPYITLPPHWSRSGGTPHRIPGAHCGALVCRGCGDMCVGGVGDMCVGRAATRKFGFTPFLPSFAKFYRFLDI